MVRIDKDIVIDVDNENYVAKVEKHRKDKNGVDMYDLIGYYTTFDSALKGVLRWKIANSLTEGEIRLNEAICVVNSCIEEFNTKIDGLVGGNL